jgi:hypothetical protein
VTRQWWPWHDPGASSPAPEPAPADRIELTSAALNALSRAHVDRARELHQAQLDRAHAVIEAALRRYGNGPIPGDVLLDVRLALQPVKLRPEVPIVPGPDGATRA